MTQEKNFKVVGINHIGIAAKSPQTAHSFFKDILGIPFIADELVSDQNTLTRMFDSTEDEASPTRIELLEMGSNEKKWPIQSFMDKKGGGIHHIALSVSDLEAALIYLKSKKVQLIDETPRQGAHHTKIAFIHPRSTGGVLVELVEQ